MKDADSERRRPVAAPASRPAAGMAATLRTPGDVQKPYQDQARRHEVTKPLSTKAFRVFVAS
jgi:hypothetical protein